MFVLALPILTAVSLAGCDPMTSCSGWLMGFTSEHQRQAPVSAAAHGDLTAVSAGSNNVKMLQLKYVTVGKVI